MQDGQEHLSNQALFILLSEDDKDYLSKVSKTYCLTRSQQQQLMVMMRDMNMWNEASFAQKKPEATVDLRSPRPRETLMTAFRDYYRTLAAAGHDYLSSPTDAPPATTSRFIEISDGRNIMGRCPVASEKTRCCNLYTLDAVFRCGFDCSYCSIQSFYDDGKISFHGNLADKLENLDLDSEKPYHIGTGQSSDSLMWGNREGLLENLMSFAAKRPQVILELKTKSDNIRWLMENPVPANVLVTWSLNTDAVIANEEHQTADLERRLSAARACADRGIPIGFHFHPMVHYKNWEEEYRQLFREMKRRFSPSEVVLVSLGTLTYIKPVLKKIRNRDFKSAILQMPMEEIAGKYSYPFEIKRKMFSLAADELYSWRDAVFFYLCMEDPGLWQPVLGRQYPDNDSFERDMLDHYSKKCREIAARR